MMEDTTLLFLAVVVGLYLLYNLSRRKEVRGIARNVNTRTEQSVTPFLSNKYFTDTVLFFAVEVVDSQGNIIQLCPVEIRGERITGFINDGNEVEVQGIVDWKGILKPKRIKNHTYNSLVSAKSPFATFTKIGTTIGCTLQLVFGLLWLLFMLAILGLFLGLLSLIF